MLGDHIFDEYLTACGGHGGHIGAGLDLVGNDAVAAAGQMIYTANLDGVGAGSLDVGTHGIEEVGQVHNVRLLGGVFDDGAALGQHGGHHDIHGGAYGHYVQIYGCAGETAGLGTGLNEAALHLHLCAHGAEALDMLVDGPHTEVAAAGHGHGSLAKAAQQSADEIVRGADTAGQIIGRMGGTDGMAIQLHGVAVQHPDPGAQLLQNIQQQRNIADLRDVFNAAGAVHQQGGGDDGNGGILRAADGNFTKKRPTAANKILIHKCPFREVL